MAARLPFAAAPPREWGAEQHLPQSGGVPPPALDLLAQFFDDDEFFTGLLPEGLELGSCDGWMGAPKPAVCGPKPVPPSAPAGTTNQNLCSSTPLLQHMAQLQSLVYGAQRNPSASLVPSKIVNAAADSEAAICLEDLPFLDDGLFPETPASATSFSLNNGNSFSISRQPQLPGLRVHSSNSTMLGSPPSSTSADTRLPLPQCHQSQTAPSHVGPAPPAFLNRRAACLTAPGAPVLPPLPEAQPLWSVPSNKSQDTTQSTAHNNAGLASHQHLSSMSDGAMRGAAYNQHHQHQGMAMAYHPTAGGRPSLIATMSMAIAAAAAASAASAERGNTSHRLQRTSYSSSYASDSDCHDVASWVGSNAGGVAQQRQGVPEMRSVSGGLDPAQDQHMHMQQQEQAVAAVTCPLVLASAPGMTLSAFAPAPAPAAPAAEQACAALPVTATTSRPKLFAARQESKRIAQTADAVAAQQQQQQQQQQLALLASSSGKASKRRDIARGATSTPECSPEPAAALNTSSKHVAGIKRSLNQPQEQQQLLLQLDRRSRSRSAAASPGAGGDDSSIGVGACWSVRGSPAVSEELPHAGNAAVVNDASDSAAADLQANAPHPTKRQRLCRLRAPSYAKMIEDAAPTAAAASPAKSSSKSAVAADPASTATATGSSIKATSTIIGGSSPKRARSSSPAAAAPAGMNKAAAGSATMTPRPIIMPQRISRSVASADTGPADMAAGRTRKAPKGGSAKQGKGRKVNGLPVSRNIPTFGDVVAHGYVPAGTIQLSIGYIDNLQVEVAPDGAITHEGVTYPSISAFALAVLQARNPERRACDGWREVCYNGMKLVHFRKTCLQAMAKSGELHKRLAAMRRSGGVTGKASA